MENENKTGRDITGENQPENEETSELSDKTTDRPEEDEDLIEDLSLSASELIELTKSRLKTIQNMRDAYSTIATNELNKVFKRLTSIAIFMAIHSRKV